MALPKAVQRIGDAADRELQKLKDAQAGVIDSGTEGNPELNTDGADLGVVPGIVTPVEGTPLTQIPDQPLTGFDWQSEATAQKLFSSVHCPSERHCVEAWQCSAVFGRHRSSFTTHQPASSHCSDAAQSSSLAGRQAPSRAAHRPRSGQPACARQPSSLATHLPLSTPQSPRALQSTDSEQGLQWSRSHTKPPAHSSGPLQGASLAALQPTSASAVVASVQMMAAALSTNTSIGLVAPSSEKAAQKKTADDMVVARGRVDTLAEELTECS